MDLKKLYNHFFLKGNIILCPIISPNIKKAKRELISQHSFINASGKEQLIHISILQTSNSMAL